MFNILREYAKSQIVSRKDVEKLTGGLLTVSALTKNDYLKMGISNPQIIRGKIYYSIENVIDWLNKHFEQI